MERWGPNGQGTDIFIDRVKALESSEKVDFGRLFTAKKRKHHRKLCEWSG